MDGESRSDRKRREILAAACSLFTREGYANTGMEMVARDAGVSTATLYAHFPSKADLFKVVVEQTIAQIGGDVRKTTEAGGDARARLTAFARAYAQFYVDPIPRAIFRVVAAERRRFGETADRVEEHCRRDLGGTAIAIISDLVEAGALKVEKPSWAAGQLLGMIEHATLTYGLVAGDITPRRPLPAMCDDAVSTFLARYGVTGKAV